jgi:CheY-like chemotaxis protein
VTLELDVPHDEMRVMGDGVRLQQVVSNLVSNGVKFTPRGGRVGVRLCRVGDSAEIAVSDTGRGLSPEAPEEIFTPFRQVGELAGPSQGGLGLGLAIVRQLVELHRGTVRAESAGPGRGSCFTVKLPLSPVRAAPLRPGGRESSLTPPPQIRGVEVLLVEDDGYTRRGLERVLVQAGADVTVAGTAAEAVEALDRKRFDVLLCDLALPDGTGFDLLPRLRARDRGGRERLRAVAVTALAGERDRERALKAGFDAHLAKPTDVRDLLRAVARLSGRLDPP